MSDVQARSQLRYKRPPILERVLTVTADVSPENFFGRFERWKDVIRETFPEYEPINDWKLNIETREDGTPLLTHVQPELEITHRFWRRNNTGKRFMSMRIAPNQLSLNLNRDSEDCHLFNELYDEYSKWLPQWMTHFGATGCANVTLNYVNLISCDTTPQFVDASGSIQVGRVLRVFAGVPGRHMGIVPPYDCQMGLMIDEKKPAIFALRVLGVTIAKDNSPAIRVDFQAAVTKPKPSLSAIEALSEASFLHTIIIDQFESIFTEDAKRSFEPVTQ